MLVLQQQIRWTCTDKADGGAQGHRPLGSLCSTCWHKVLPHASYDTGTCRKGASGTHCAAGALAAVLQTADVLPGAVGLQPSHQCLQRAAVHQLLPLEDILVQEAASISAGPADTCNSCSSAPAHGRGTLHTHFSLCTRRTITL